jgi:hypothetical protein
MLNKIWGAEIHFCGSRRNFFSKFAALVLQTSVAPAWKLRLIT